MNPAITESISIITVLLQGFLSFFSPCVLPLMPLYLGYLSGGIVSMSSDKELKIGRMRVLLNTVCFVPSIRRGKASVIHKIVGKAILR